jgi:hypothetical protein
MNESWIKLFRKFREWEWYSDLNVSRLFIELLLTVNHEDKKWKGITIKRGQILTGVQELGKRCSLNYQQTRTALDKLISTNEITKSTTATYTILTINKFNDYQVVTKSLTNEQRSSNEVVTTTKDKNIRNKDITTVESETYLNKWNYVFNRNFKNTSSFKGNLEHWLKTYSIDEICIAIERIQLDEYWGDKTLDPTWLLRKSNGKEQVDYIGRMLNLKKKQEFISLN